MKQSLRCLKEPEDGVKPKKKKKRKNVVAPNTNVITVAEQVSNETENSVQSRLYQKLVYWLTFPSKYPVELRL